MGEDATEEWLSITEAAARLTMAGDQVDRSTLSRYVSQHAEAIETRRQGKANLVEFGALARHRGENVRLRRPGFGFGGGEWGGPGAGGHAGQGGSHAVGTGAAAAGAKGAGGAYRPGAHAPRGTQADGLARKINADAEMRELDLAKRRGELTPTVEVDRAGRDAIALMLAAFDRAVETEASSLSVRYGWDERVTRIALKGFAKRGLEVFNREIRERLDQAERAGFADEDATPDAAAADPAAASRLQ
jgi:hypothetical protein